MSRMALPSFALSSDGRVLARADRALALRRAALWLARRSAGGRAVTVVARYCPRLIPGRIFVSPDLIVFGHPRPIAEVHLVAMPRTYIRDVLDWSPRGEDFWAAVDAWFTRYAEDHGVRAAVTNVGTRQEVRFLHVHLISELPAWLTTRGPDPVDTLVAALHRSIPGDCGRRDGRSYGGIRTPTGWVVRTDASSQVSRVAVRVEH